MSSGYSSEGGHGWVVLTLCALVLGALLKVPVPDNTPSCVTVTGIKAAPMVNGRQKFTYYEKEVCDE